MQRRTFSAEAGMTLLELIITCAILLVLSSAALPIAKYTIVRQKETELRQDLLEMRDAIDRYKDAADRNQIRVEIGSEGYPPNMETLVTGVQLGTSGDLVTIRIRQAGAEKTCLTFTRSQRGRRWTGQSIRIGSWNEEKR